VRVLLDTNVVIAAFATRGLCQDVMQVVIAEHDLILGHTVLDEVERNLQKKLRMPKSAAAEVIDFLRAHAEVVRSDAPASVPKRDQDDRWVVAAALHGTADVLVTGDDDLLSITSNLPVAIVSPRGFWEMLRRHGTR